MKYTIGVTGTGSLIGQAIIKCIKRSEFGHQYNLIGFDYFQNTVGSFWCEQTYILPDILKSENVEVWIDELERVIKLEGIEILFVGVDFELPIFAKFKQRIATNTGCIVIVSDEEVIRIGNDKYLTYEFLKNNGLSYPETLIPENTNLNVLQFPLIIKPRVGARSVGVHRLNNKQDLDLAMSKVNGPILQELIGDDESEYTCGVIFWNGEVHHSIALRRSLKDGNTFMSEYRKDFPSVINEYIKDICIKLKPSGVCNFQLRLDKNNVPKLFEINPRHSGTTFIRSLFGYNEVIYLLRLLLENVHTKFELQEGKAMRYFEESLTK